MNRQQRPSEFMARQELAPEWLAEELARRGYRVEEQQATTFKSRFFDTFDWRLLAKGLVLVHRGAGFQLYGAADGREIAHEPGRAGGNRFSHDFPPGLLRDTLAKIIEMRVLLPLLDLSSKERRWEIRNTDDKLVLRYRLRRLLPRRAVIRPADPHPPPDSGAPSPQPLHLLGLEPVTGYPKPLSEARELLAAEHLVPAVNLAGQLYRQVGLMPVYGKKALPALRPDWPAAKAALEILRHQYRVMLRNQAGILADLDSEFLHDYRVALRRSRAVLARIKGVLPPAVGKRFRARLGELARLSNRLRDLDVYLLKKTEYRAMLPPGLQAGLEPLFLVLEEERRREFRKLARKMKSADYRRSMNQWGDFLAAYDPLLGETMGAAARSAAEPAPAASRATGGKSGEKIEPAATDHLVRAKVSDHGAPQDAGSRERLQPAHALLPVLPLAEKAIAKACSRLIAHGRAIGPDSPDEALHALRLDCKKLRYLFEFFAGLFSAADVAPLINRTKKLQDNLGAFNDFFIQQQALRHFLVELGRTAGPVRTGSGRAGGGGRKGEGREKSQPAEAITASAAAIGGLITQLNREQHKVRRDFAKTFKEFTACQHRKKFCPEE